MKRFVLMSFLLFSLAADAEMLVVGIEGGSRHITVERAGAAIPVKPLTLLEAGDRVQVTEAKARLVLVDTGGKELIVNHENAPFRVPQSDKPSWLDNAMREALIWYRGLARRRELVVAAIVRGDDEPPALLGMASDENLVPAGMLLRVFWIGGVGPYRVELESAGNTIKRIDAVESPVSVATEDLAEGRYRIRIIDRSMASRTGDEQGFELIAPETLPPAVREILASGLPQPARLRLASARLAGYVEFRFTALQYAAESGDTMLEQALLAGLRPDRP